jgi:hypothetical protein
MGRLIPVKAKDQTLYAQVDDEDFERLSKFKWYERNAKAVELYGECATLNFPTQGQASGGGGVSAVS